MSSSPKGAVLNDPSPLGRNIKGRSAVDPRSLAVDPDGAVIVGQQASLFRRDPF